MPHLIYIFFFFALGACVGSFLNVVVWRLPRGESLVLPPSHCPKCQTHLKWYDNIPVLGWVFLAGRCRYCKEKISPRYPIVEALTGSLFVVYYVMFFVFQIGPCARVRVDPFTFEGRILHGMPLDITRDWAIYGLDMFLLSGLLAASLIDAESFTIPLQIPWLIVPIALIVHPLFDRGYEPGALSVGPTGAALAVGGTLGVLISIVLLYTGIFPRSFADGGPAMEMDRETYEREAKTARKRGEEPPAEPIEYTPRMIRAEARKEMMFLMPPIVLAALAALLVSRFGPAARGWTQIVRHQWVASLLASALGGLVGGFTVWLTRILGSYVFGKEAMGMGDVDLMAAVGAALGAGPAVVAFFLAPVFGIAYAIYMLVRRSGRQLPYGPYLSLATAFVMLFYCPIAAYLAPGLSNAAWMLQHLVGG
ncbi:MAG TPA: prepilin peptidase [Tepidisphaeraceae bacterium]|nr:prepilin peptidase [Tepidisphaeraceae bacterium]